MRRAALPPSPIQLLAALTADMSSRPSYSRGGGRRPFGRTYSDRPGGDSNFRPVHDAGSGHRGARPRPFYQNQSHNPRFFRQGPVPVDQNQNQNRAFRPAQQVRPRQQKPLDYRDWEYAKTAPPRDSDKFTILSYNILADCHAINQRSKLYFHIPRHMLDWQWRKKNIVFELGLWAADILCFQEVDRFGELAEELNKRGYDGIWKMRTGTAVDGCAIFWRTSRFKLVYEESIEYNKHGLRDNVSQICVLELMERKNKPNTSALPKSSSGSNKVVVCNIHVLYNPRRGEIKLGQVRRLLDRARAVSKDWDDAPVVLCGDFNCTPKSPLYKFISEQKLDLSGIDRDKVSGQASAEIHAHRPYNSGRFPNPNPSTLSSETSIQGAPKVDNELGDSISNTQKENNFGSRESISCVKETKETQLNVVDSCNSGIGSCVSVLADEPKGSSTAFQSEDKFPVIEMDGGVHKSTTSVNPNPVVACPGTNEMEQGEKVNYASVSSQGLLSEHPHSTSYEENLCKNFVNLELSSENSPSENFGSLSPQPIASDGSSGFGLSNPDQTNVLHASTSICNVGEKQLEDISLQELNFLDDRIAGEDQSTFLSALQGLADPPQHDFGYSPSELSPDLNDLSTNEVLQDVSLDMDSDTLDVEKPTYDPSAWTPTDIETATGNAVCTSLEHPLKLKSAYTEAEDCSGTRDPNGEPLVTSYNRCFFGTVDYIWSSEGLQTVRVLAPLPKHAMQWTPGFPTKKWGSDHIALVSELAFTNRRK